MRSDKAGSKPQPEYAIRGADGRDAEIWGILHLPA